MAPPGALDRRRRFGGSRSVPPRKRKRVSSRDEGSERSPRTGRSGGSFFRREGRLTERETLISRLIDRSCRPLFPEGYQHDTQIIATVFSADNQYDTDVLALTGASYALAVSDIPFPFAFAGVRVGRVGGKLIANPSEEERTQGDLDVIMAASRDSIFMVE